MELEKAQHVAERLIEMYCRDYTFAFDNAVRRFGSCNLHKKVITLSRSLVLLNNVTDVKQTILHEIAHAITREKHTKNWLQVARSIGYNGGRLYGKHVITPPKRYTYKCECCSRLVECHRRKDRTACGVCCKKYNNGKWSGNYLLKEIK